jgi:hypothetical protein
MIPLAIVRLYRLIPPGIRSLWAANSTSHLALARMLSQPTRRWSILRSALTFSVQGPSRGTLWGEPK